MPGPLTRALAALIGLAGCAANSPASDLAAIGAETKSPPTAERQAIEAAVAQWAQGRFAAGTPRWFTLKPGTPPVAVMKAVDNGMAGRAVRIVETGPDGAPATLYGWRLKKRAADGSTGVIAAVSRGDGRVAAYCPIVLSAGWPAE